MANKIVEIARILPDIKMNFKLNMHGTSILQKKKQKSSKKHACICTSKKQKQKKKTNNKIILQEDDLNVHNFELRITEQNSTKMD